MVVRCIFLLQNGEDEFRPPIKKRKVGRPRKNTSSVDEASKKQNQKKEKQVFLSSSLLNGVATVVTNKVETSSSGQYKIKPKLKAEVKVS